MMGYCDRHAAGDIEHAIAQIEAQARHGLTIKPAQAEEIVRKLLRAKAYVNNSVESELVEWRERELSDRVSTLQSRIDKQKARVIVLERVAMAARGHLYGYNHEILDGVTVVHDDPMYALMVAIDELDSMP